MLQLSQHLSRENENRADLVVYPRLRVRKSNVYFFLAFLAASLRTLRPISREAVKAAKEEKVRKDKKRILSHNPGLFQFSSIYAYLRTSCFLGGVFVYNGKGDFAFPCRAVAAS